MAETKITSIEQFAEHFRLKITRDECNDKIIQGSRGHLYFDGPELCYMALNCRMGPVKAKTVGGSLWFGDASRDDRNRMVRDVWIKQIPRQHWGKAVRLAQIPKRPLITEERKEQLREQIKTLRPPVRKAV